MNFQVMMKIIIKISPQFKLHLIFLPFILKNLHFQQLIKPLVISEN